MKRDTWQEKKERKKGGKKKKRELAADHIRFPRRGFLHMSHPSVAYDDLLTPFSPKAPPRAEVTVGVTSLEPVTKVQREEISTEMICHNYRFHVVSPSERVFLLLQ